MQINNFFYPIYSLIKDKFITVLKNTNKKILIAASIAFSFLSACFVIKSFLSRKVAKIDPKIDATIKLTDNLVFKGECQKFFDVEGQEQLQPDGTGELFYQETVIYGGEFKEGKPHGVGTIFFPKENLVIFHDKLKDLKEIINSNLKDLKKFEGRFEKGMFKRSNDEVKLTLRDGKTIVGKLEEAEEDNLYILKVAKDRATLICTDGIICVRNPNKGKDEIMLIYPNKDCYMGKYIEIEDREKKGKCIYVPEGNGIMIYANGEIYKGEFRDGVPHTVKEK